MFISDGAQENLQIIPMKFINKIKLNKVQVS